MNLHVVKPALVTTTIYISRGDELVIHIAFNELSTNREKNNLLFLGLSHYVMTLIIRA
jgi:hypothetical protein